MRRLGLEREVVDADVYESSVRRFRQAGIVMPTFAQLADPCSMPIDLLSQVGEVDPDGPHPLNLFRTHWHNDRGQKMPVSLPAHVMLPPELTGVFQFFYPCFSSYTYPCFWNKNTLKITTSNYHILRYYHNFLSFSSQKNLHSL